jgi:hypothetical protein
LQEEFVSLLVEVILSRFWEVDFQISRSLVPNYGCMMHSVSAKRTVPPSMLLYH